MTGLWKAFSAARGVENQHSYSDPRGEPSSMKTRDDLALKKKNRIRLTPQLSIFRTRIHLHWESSIRLDSIDCLAAPPPSVKMQACLYSVRHLCLRRQVLLVHHPNYRSGRVFLFDHTRRQWPAFGVWGYGVGREAKPFDISGRSSSANTIADFSTMTRFPLCSVFPLTCRLFPVEINRLDNQVPGYGITNRSGNTGS